MSRRIPAPPCVLTIAGSDSGGGAGAQADARTIHACGGFACMALTAITAQNTRGVARWHAEPAELITAQIEAVLGPAGGARADGALPIRAIKTGLLPGAAAVGAVAEALAGRGEIPLVVDPVIGSTSGTRFLDTDGIRTLRERLLPGATLVTPNWPEAEALTGLRLTTYAAAERAGRQLASATGAAVLVKGGHGPGPECRDCLVTRDGRVRWFASARIDTPNTHGTGCVLSAAIAAELARGASLVAAVGAARRFLQRALRKGRRVDWAGAGPAYF